MKDRIYLGNLYGKHDGFDGSVFSKIGIAKGVVASVGGISCMLDIRKKEKKCN